MDRIAAIAENHRTAERPLRLPKLMLMDVSDTSKVGKSKYGHDPLITRCKLATACTLGVCPEWGGGGGGTRLLTVGNIVCQKSRTSGSSVPYPEIIQVLIVPGKRNA